MKKINKHIKYFIIAIAIAMNISCNDTGQSQNQVDNTNQNDTTSLLVGKWQFEEMGIALNLEINSDKTFFWSSDFGNFNGSWSRKNKTLFFTPSDNFNPPFTLVLRKDGSLEDQTSESVKPIYKKI